MITTQSLDITILEDKWISGDSLTSEETSLLSKSVKEHQDIRVREACRVLLAATLGDMDGEPHVQRLMKMRNQTLLEKKTIRIQP